MTFVSFLILCAVGLLGYYVYLVLAPGRKRNTYDLQSTASMKMVVEIEPIEVRDDMVTYKPNEPIENSQDNGSKEDPSSPEDNKYSPPNNQSMSSGKGEYLLTVTSDDCATGKSIVSHINI